MERHDLDPVALVFGAMFIILGTAYAIAGWSWIGVDSGWLLGALLIALGIAGIVSVTTRQRHRATRATAVDAADDDPSTLVAR